MSAPPIANPYAGRFIPLPKPREKCIITGMCRASIYNFAARGELRLVKFGRSIRLDAEHAFNWMNSRPTHVVMRANIAPQAAGTSPNASRAA